MKNSCIVSIHSAKQNQTTVGIQIGTVKKELTHISEFHTSQKVLPLLESLLTENNLTYEDITGIVVDTGPGSFTGLRVGATIGNMLGWLLQVPVNGKNIPVTKLMYGDDKWG